MEVQNCLLGLEFRFSCLSRQSWRSRSSYTKSFNLSILIRSFNMFIIPHVSSRAFNLSTRGNYLPIEVCLGYHRFNLSIWDPKWIVNLKCDQSHKLGGQSKPKDPNPGNTKRMWRLSGLTQLGSNSLSSKWTLLTSFFDQISQLPIFFPLGSLGMVQSMAKNRSGRMKDDVLWVNLEYVLILGASWICNWPFHDTFLQARFDKRLMASWADFPRFKFGLWIVVARCSLSVKVVEDVHTYLGRSLLHSTA